MAQFLGLDIGSSSVKASVIDGETGVCLASAFSPKREMNIIAHNPGWAEQEPSVWWENIVIAVREVLSCEGVEAMDIKAIGISYQMHGLVCIDKDGQVLRPSIIWCDSRAVEIGSNAFNEIGAEYCLSHILNSPGNFTASKLKWIKNNEPELYERIDAIMLPGDYISFRLTGEKTTTISGLSEGMMWDFKNNKLAGFLFEHYGINESLIPAIVPVFSNQGQILPSVARELGLNSDVIISYRAGDQPNNALSLNVLNPGEIAATAGTSGVVYGVSSDIKYDPFSRVNTFAHVNHTETKNRLGVLLCINGTGILNSWLNKYVGGGRNSYEQMNELAMRVNPGADGLLILPFGNGAERVLGNVDTGASFLGINFNRHNEGHIYRAAQEGIVYSFQYGMEIMKQNGIFPTVIRAGKANMFLSPLFREALSAVSGATIELYDTDGSQGAARGAAFGSGYYSSLSEAFKSLKKLDEIEPDKSLAPAYKAAYTKWKEVLMK